LLNVGDCSINKYYTVVSGETIDGWGLGGLEHYSLNKHHQTIYGIYLILGILIILNTHYDQEDKNPG